MCSDNKLLVTTPDPGEELLSSFQIKPAGLLFAVIPVGQAPYETCVLIQLASLAASGEV